MECGKGRQAGEESERLGDGEKRQRGSEKKIGVRL